MSTAKQLLDKVGTIKNSGNDIALQRNRATMDGALIGMAVGFYYGFSRRQNLLVCGLMGGIGGAIIGRLLVPA